MATISFPYLFSYLGINKKAKSVISLNGKQVCLPEDADSEVVTHNLNFLKTVFFKRGERFKEETYPKAFIDSKGKIYRSKSEITGQFEIPEKALLVRHDRQSKIDAIPCNRFGDLDKTLSLEYSLELFSKYLYSNDSLNIVTAT